MKNSKLIGIGLLVLTVLILSSLTFAQVINNGVSGLSVDPAGCNNCRLVTNNFGEALFFNEQVCSDWQSFISYPPSGVSFAACCTPNSYSACSGGDRYWYNSCGVMGGMREDCVCGCSSDACIGTSTWYLDADSDGYYPTGGTTNACSSPGAGWSTTPKTAGDCNDGNGGINPGAGENVCNGVDDNCNGQTDEGYNPSVYTQCGSSSHRWWISSCGAETSVAEYCNGQICVNADTSRIRTGCSGNSCTWYDTGCGPYRGSTYCASPVEIRWNSGCVDPGGCATNYVTSCNNGNYFCDVNDMNQRYQYTGCQGGGPASCTWSWIETCPYGCDGPSATCNPPPPSQCWTASGGPHPHGTQMWLYGDPWGYGYGQGACWDGYWSTCNNGNWDDYAGWGGPYESCGYPY